MKMTKKNSPVKECSDDAACDCIHFIVRQHPLLYWSITDLFWKVRKYLNNFSLIFGILFKTAFHDLLLALAQYCKNE